MAKMRIYVVDLESVPSRYTCEWKKQLPIIIENEIQKHGKDIRVINISGGEESIEATPGAFLNFQATNIYKNNQLNDIARRFTNEVKPGDKFIFADAWHTGILQLKYMSELLQIPVEIHALWHAGSYDPQDFLGRLIKDKKWTYATESALYHAIDYSWFATEFHANLFMNTLFPDGKNYDGVYQTGWPMEYMPDLFSKYDSTVKEDIIIFPHRLAPEKQPEIFRDLAATLPEYHFVVCQDSKLSKKEYHEVLAKSKLMWSANLQETLGISPFEGALLGVIPMLPDRLSYSEMYPVDYLYSSAWTDSFDNYMLNKSLIVDHIRYNMENYDTISTDVRTKLAPHLLKNYFSATTLLQELLS
jgi:glycosyltransferase involved in cell wall biosynthesis